MATRTGDERVADGRVGPLVHVDGADADHFGSHGQFFAHAEYAHFWLDNDGRVVVDVAHGDAHGCFGSANWRSLVPHLDLKFVQRFRFAIQRVFRGDFACN